MPGNGDGGIDIGIHEKAPGWVVFQPGISPTTNLDRVPNLLASSIARWLAANPGIQVRVMLPLVVDGTTLAVHVWFEGH